MIIVILQVGAVKIYVTAVEALSKKERHDDENSIYDQNWWKKTSSGPSYFVL